MDPCPVAGFTDSMTSLHGFSSVGAQPRFVSGVVEADTQVVLTAQTMTRGYVTHFDARRGIGFVQHQHGGTPVPFTTRDAQERGSDLRLLREGDTVEYRVSGGMTGVIAYALRRVA